MKNFTLKPLPIDQNIETRAALKKTASAHRYLAELKGMASAIPNEDILISTLTLQEAKDSSEIENIITTQDDLYKSELFAEYIKNPAELLFTTTGSFVLPVTPRSSPIAPNSALITVSGKTTMRCTTDLAKVAMSR